MSNPFGIMLLVLSFGLAAAVWLNLRLERKSKKRS